MQAMDQGDHLIVGRSKSSASGHRDWGGESSDDGRPKSSRSSRGRASRISIGDIEAARIAAAAASQRELELSREIGLGLGGPFDWEMEEIKESHRRHRHTSGDGGKRQKRSRSSPRTTGRSKSRVSQRDVELARAAAAEPDPALSRHSSRDSRSSRHAEDYSSVEGYATIKRRPKGSRKPAEMDIQDSDQFRRTSVRSITSEEEFMRLEMERSSSRASERSSRRKEEADDDRDKSKILRYKAFQNRFNSTQQNRTIGG